MDIKNNLELDELIAIFEYKSQNIKMHISPATMKQVVEILKEYKDLKQKATSTAKGFAI